MPFLTGRFLTDPDQLQWYRPLYRIPSQPPPQPVSGDIAPPEPPASESLVEPPAAAERLGGVTMRLDISVWRLPHLWRLVVSFVARRLGR
jgi:hypothetical protein